MVMEANGMEPLLTNFTSDPDVTVRTKALGAISCKHRILLFVLCNVHSCDEEINSCFFAALIRHNKSGIAAFRLANGYAALRDALGSESVRFQRYIIQTISGSVV